MKAPTVIDVPTEELASAVITAEGGLIRYGKIAVDVPAGAVAQDTTVSITRLAAPFYTEPAEDAPSDAVQAELVSMVHDFGPAGVTFEKPVTVTLPYDPGLGPDVRDPERVVVAYWNGEEWAIAGGTADPSTRTVSVQLQKFEGSILVAVAIGVGAGLVVQAGIRWWKDPEMVKDDHVSEGTAKNWVTFDKKEHPVVQQQAARAVILDPVSKQTKPLSDPKVSEWVESICKSGYDPALVYKNPDGSISQSVYEAGEGSNWQKPSDYFTTGTPIRQVDGKPFGGPLHGDCTDLTNSAVSVLRAAGFHAKGVMGYGNGGTNQSRVHAWGEVLIGNKVYRIDEGGAILAADNTADQSMAKGHYDDYAPITDPNDPRFQSMWDETGQKPYAADWWTEFVTYDVNGHWSGTMMWKAMELNEEAKQQALNQGCDAGFFDELLNKPLPLTLEVKVDGAGKGTATLTVDVSSLQKYNSNIKSSPETYECTLAGDKLSIKLKEAGTMVCKLSQQGKDLTMSGSMTVNQEGSSMTIEIAAKKGQ